jgi:diguanylate cyclase (GGDEF)-like protein
MSTTTPISGESPPDAVPVPSVAIAPIGPGRVSPPLERPRRVLVVEPSEAEGLRLHAELTAGGLEVHICADLAGAEEEASRVQPGLILARWDLPAGVGLDLLRRLGQGSATDWIPVILHGGGATAEERVAAFELGALDVMATPPVAAELVARLRAGLRLRERMDHLERRAYRDGLTGLINRGALEDHLRHHWEASRRHGTSLSVLIIDVDRFKEINDTHGHPAGDEALRRTAAVLARSVRCSDVVARFGGDEFMIVAPACPPAAAVPMVGRFRDALAAPPDPPAGRAIAITLSIGIAGTDDATAADLDELLEQADRALYLAKRSGRDAVALYDPSSGRPTLLV